MRASSPRVGWRTGLDCQFSSSVPSRVLMVTGDVRACKAALQKIVDFAYTGKIELAGSTVVAIIQAAR